MCIPCAEASRAETFDGLASLPRWRGWPAGPGPAASRSPVRPPLLRGSLHAGRGNPARALEADQLARLRPMLPDGVRMDSGMSGWSDDRGDRAAGGSRGVQGAHWRTATRLRLRWPSGDGVRSRPPLGHAGGRGAKPTEDTRRGGRRSKNTRTAARAIGPRQTAVRHALPTAEQDRFAPGWTTRPDQSQRCALPSLRVPGHDSGITQNSGPAGSRITCQE